MKRKRRRRMRKMASERVLMDGCGQEEYHVVEKRLPGRRKSVYDTYIVRQKRTGRDYLIEIMLQWLIRLIVNLLPVNIWNEG